MTDLTIDIMRRLWPHGDQHVPGLVEAIVAQAPTVFPHYGFDSALVIAHFWGQVSEECGAGGEMTENTNYSEQGLIRTWPTRFGRDRAAKFAHNPQMIAETVYGGRMGNDPYPSHDGWFYRGHGLTQLTGKENYLKVGHAMGLDLVGEPDLANDPEYALEIGCVDFLNCTHEGKNCLEWAKADNVVNVTKALNGGLIGLSDRRAWLRKWKSALSVK